MRTTKYVLFAALGIAAVLLLTSDAAKDMRDDLEEKAKKNAKKWKGKLNKMGSDTADTISDLKDMLSNEIEGLSDDARERIETILNGSAKSATKIKGNLSKQLS
jgi:gas vesicle protein